MRSMDRGDSRVFRESRVRGSTGKGLDVLAFHWVCCQCSSDPPTVPVLMSLLCIHCPLALLLHWHLIQCSLGVGDPVFFMSWAPALHLVFGTQSVSSNILLAHGRTFR